MDIHEILRDIASTPKTSLKLEKLIKALTSDTDDLADITLYKILKLALTPTQMFGVNSKRVDVESYGTKTDMDEILLFLEDFAPFTNNKEIETLASFLSNYTEECVELAKKVIDKDLGLGVAVSTANKALKATGKETLEYLQPMKAYKERDVNIDEFQYPAIAQTKIDAARCYLACVSGSVVILSSSGKAFIDTNNQFPDLTATIKQLTNGNGVIDGEIIFKDENGDFLPRQKSNGIFNKMIKGTIKDEEAKRVHFIAWDLLDDIDVIFGAECKDRYSVRFAKLTGSIVNNPQISVVDTQIVENADEARQLAVKAFEAGEEGIILKTMDHKYVNKRTKNLVKLKKEAMADVRVTGVNEGKNPGTLGSLSYETDDGKIRGDVSGITEGLKEEWWAAPSRIVGKVIEVRYMEVCEDTKNGIKTGIMTLYGPPVFIRVRDDKFETSRLEELV